MCEAHVDPQGVACTHNKNPPEADFRLYLTSYATEYLSSLLFLKYFGFWRLTKMVFGLT